MAPTQIGRINAQVQDAAFDLYLQNRYLKRANEAKLHEGSSNPWATFDVLTNEGLAKHASQRSTRLLLRLAPEQREKARRIAEAMIKTAENSGHLWVRGEIPEVQ